MSLDDWNRRYRENADVNDTPATLLIEAAADHPPGRALDLACGAGRNAIWLAEHGWDVVAIDGADEAIRIVRERAGSLPVDARVMDLESGAALPFPDASFDLVAILFYLHRPLFEEAKRVIKPGGLIVAAVRMSGINPKYCVGPGELRSHFEGFEIVHASENEVAEVIARRGGPPPAQVPRLRSG